MSDLVLLDIALPDGNGLDLARTIKNNPCAPKVVMLTLYDTQAYRAAALAAGTDGFLSKSDLGECLQALIGELFPDICPPAGAGQANAFESTSNSLPEKGGSTDGNRLLPDMGERITYARKRGQAARCTAHARAYR
jgi:DNA-binding NarL/FixJ family response regulator